MKPCFEEVKKNFGFGCMRLPMVDGQVDLDHFSRMVDTFLEAGFNYFDTAHGYIDGKSETAIRACLTSRHPRESYILTNKLTETFFQTEEDIRPCFQAQLDACGVEYFDFYLMHCQTRENFDHFQKCHAYETAFRLKEEGKVRHVGLSFHDDAEFLDHILTTYPQVEVVQLQFNYIDYENPNVQSRACLEVCRKHQKPVIVMEPVKGGSLIRLPEAAQTIFDQLHGGSNASYAIRFAASFDGIVMVLSGMGDMDMMNDNISYMKDFIPLTEKELEAIREVCKIIQAQDRIDCTSCRYCTEVCPQNIAIPDLFACYNSVKQWNNWGAKWRFNRVQRDGGKIEDCLQCGACEHACPQHLPIRDLLQATAKLFE